MFNSVNSLLFIRPQGEFITKLLAMILLSCILTDTRAQQDVDSTALSETTYVPFKELDAHYGYLIRLQQKKDSLKYTLKHSIVMGIRHGRFIFPGYIKTDLDSLTGTDISAQTQQWILFAEYYYNEHWAWGAELGIHGVKRVQDIAPAGGGSMNINAAGGTNLNVALSGKYIWGNPGSALPSPSISATQRLELQDIEGKIDRINATNNKYMRKPRIYNSFSLGFTQTVLLKLKGNSNVTLSRKSYIQTVPTISAGLGVLSRISRCLQFDLGAKYVLSKAYNPSIGSVTSYSGFNIQLSMGFLFNTGYSRIKQQLISNDLK